MRIAHISIHVKNLEESAAFYKDMLRMNLAEDLQPHGARIMFFENASGDTRIEIIEDTEHAYNGSGISIGFPVDDLDAEKKRFEEAGFSTSDVISPNPAVRFFFTQDPNGVQIQIITDRH